MPYNEFKDRQHKLNINYSNSTLKVQNKNFADVSKNSVSIFQVTLAERGNGKLGD